METGNGEYIPEIVFVMFQGKFAIIAPALIAGSFAERVNFKSNLIEINKAREKLPVLRQPLLNIAIKRNPPCTTPICASVCVAITFSSLLFI